jgi:glucose-6-phosphate 1-dehydrogenase
MTAENRNGVADLLVIFGITGDLARKRLTRMRAVGLTVAWPR